MPLSQTLIILPRTPLQSSVLWPVFEKREKEGRSEECGTQTGRVRDSRGGTRPGAVRQVSWGVWGEVSQSRTGRGSRRVEGVPVSRRVEGSQHAGIAEIVSGKASFVSQLFLNSHELVVLSQTLRTARGPSLDLACAQPHHQVCDEGVLSLP